MWIPSSDAIRVSEDDVLRSQYIRGLVQKENVFSYAADDATADIPRVIFQFWDESDIPEDVKSCMETWQVFKSKGFEYHLFNIDTARKFIIDNLSDQNVEAFDRCYHPAMKSDYFRLCYIYCNGGVYIDGDDIYPKVILKVYFPDKE